MLSLVGCFNCRTSQRLKYSKTYFVNISEKDMVLSILTWKPFPTEYLLGPGNPAKWPVPCYFSHKLWTQTANFSQCIFV